MRGAILRLLADGIRDAQVQALGGVAVTGEAVVS